MANFTHTERENNKLSQVILDRILHADLNDELKQFFESGRKKILFGAGQQALLCRNMIRLFGLELEYLVAKEYRESLLIGDPIRKDADSVPNEDKENCDILISVNQRLNGEIRELLEKKGFRHIYWCDDWGKANLALLSIGVEEYLKGKLGTYSINDDLIQFHNFKIVGCHNQPITYKMMLLAEFSDIIMPSIFQDYLSFTDGPYEWGEVQLKEDDVVLDLGANIGMFSCVAASKGGQVYAFEPTPATIGLLKMNQALYERFEICPYAVCDQIGKASFYYNPENDLENNASNGHNTLLANRIDGAVIEVDTITIDAFVEREKLERVDFIKADIEGAEREMLKGARNTLARFAPKLSLCTYHLPDDKEVMERLILEANPNYVIEHKWGKLFAHVPKAEQA